MARLYLGIDGGQSSTTALIADECGRVIGRGSGGPCNHASSVEGRSKFLHAVGKCLGEACRQASLDPGMVRFASACLGLSGGPEDKELYAREVIRSAKLKITHDAEIALSGATEGEPGIIVIAGTGSIAFGRNQEGRTARAGGWGYVFGDEGGAFDLTRRALRAALQYEEGWGRETSLHRMLLDRARAKSANKLLHGYYSGDYTRMTLASWAPAVTKAAEQGDEVARQIVIRAAEKLAWTVDGVRRSLFSPGENVLVAYIGGVFRSRLLLNEFGQRLGSRIKCRVQPPRFHPAAGAVLEALRLDGNQNRLSSVPESEK